MKYYILTVEPYLYSGEINYSVFGYCEDEGVKKYYVWCMTRKQYEGFFWHNQKLE